MPRWIDFGSQESATVSAKGNVHLWNASRGHQDGSAAYQRMARAVNPVGDGRAAQQIAAVILGEPVAPFTARLSTQ